jgi:hypothetical protein
MSAGARTAYLTVGVVWLLTLVAGAFLRRPAGEPTAAPLH